MRDTKDPSNNKTIRGVYKSSGTDILSKDIGQVSEKDTNQVEPLEAKPGGKIAGTMRIISAVSDEKEEDKEPTDLDGRKNKIIDIDWTAVPYLLNLKDKMRKALELDLDHVSGDEYFTVRNGAEPHQTTENSCDCEDWMHNGTSINPCKHILRVKYPDAKLMQLLGAVEEKPKKIKEKQDSQKRELAILENEEDELLFIPDLAPALPEIGKLKIGGFSDKRTKGGQLLPEKWDHFKIGTMMKDEEGRVIIDEAMTEALGEDPTEVDVTLCYDEPALNMPSFYAAFTHSKLVCMGNGRKAWQRQDDGERKEIVCNRKECAFAKDKRCGPYARLAVILSLSNRIGGTFVFRTGSWNSIRNIISSMSFIRNQTGGVLAGIPLKLKLRSATAIPNGLGKRITIYVVNLEYAGTLEQLKHDATAEINRRLQLGLNMHELEQLQKGAIVERAKTELEADAEEIADEFYHMEETEE
jgi:hypothetical protein